MHRLGRRDSAKTAKKCEPLRRLIQENEFHRLRNSLRSYLGSVSSMWIHFEAPECAPLSAQPLSEYFTASELSEYAILWITESFSVEKFVHVGGRSRSFRRTSREKFIETAFSPAIERYALAPGRKGESPKARAIKSHGFLRGLWRACFTADPIKNRH
jgi:hypothetical protein